MTDLFGNEGRAPLASVRPVPAPVALDLFTAAAEHIALRTGRAKSQERAELVAGPGYRCLRDHALTKGRDGRLTCPCD